MTPAAPGDAAAEAAALEAPSDSMPPSMDGGADVAGELAARDVAAELGAPDVAAEAGASDAGAACLPPKVNAQGIEICYSCGASSPPCTGSSAFCDGTRRYLCCCDPNGARCCP